MDSKGPNNKLHCFQIYEDPEVAMDKESRLQQTDEAEEFFAVVQRIHALNRFVRKKRMHSISAGIVKSPWKPVFQLEDFLSLPSTAERDRNCCAKRNTNRCGVSVEDEIRSEKCMGVKIFDLNLEPHPEFC